MRFVRVLTDCRDPNAAARLSLKGAALWRATPLVVPVENEHELSGMLVDAIAVADGAKGVLLANVAPRNGHAASYPNGVPFGWFRVGETLVVTTIGHTTLSLIYKLGIVDTINELDIAAVGLWAVNEGLLDSAAARHMAATQFRSLEFAPLAAKWLSQGKKVPSRRRLLVELLPLSKGDYVWYVDCFGNCKTTILASELSGESWFVTAGRGRTTWARSSEIEGLSGLPEDGRPYLVKGSSGYGSERFVEIMINGESAASLLGIQAGESIRIRRLE